MLKKFMALVAIVALLGACETVRARKANEEFDKTLNRYHQMIRWDEMENTESFSPDNLRPEFRKRVEAVGKIKVTDYRVKKTEYMADKGEALITVEFDYYREPSITVKTIKEVEQWKYADENGNKIWRLMSWPPDFK
jgi:hypothetical protein